MSLRPRPGETAEDVIARVHAAAQARNEAEERADLASMRVLDDGGEVAYIECLPAQEAAYWEARRRGMGLTDKQIGDLLRAAAPHLREAWEREQASR